MKLADFFIAMLCTFTIMVIGVLMGEHIGARKLDAKVYACHEQHLTYEACSDLHGWTYKH